MTMLKACVQVTANAGPDKAEAIVLSSGMNVAKPRTWAARADREAHASPGGGMG